MWLLSIVMLLGYTVNMGARRHPPDMIYCSFSYNTASYIGLQHERLMPCSKKRFLDPVEYLQRYLRFWYSLQELLQSGPGQWRLDLSGTWPKNIFLLMGEGKAAGGGDRHSPNIPSYFYCIYVYCITPSFCRFCRDLTKTIASSKSAR